MAPATNLPRGRPLTPSCAMLPADGREMRFTYCGTASNVYFAVEAAKAKAAGGA